MENKEHCSNCACEDICIRWIKVKEAVRFMDSLDSKEIIKKIDDVMALECDYWRMI